jgi:hypothetical protein
MNQEPRWVRFVEKSREQKSRATVPLSCKSGLWLWHRSGSLDKLHHRAAPLLTYFSSNHIKKRSRIRHNEPWLADQLETIQWYRGWQLSIRRYRSINGPTGKHARTCTSSSRGHKRYDSWLQIIVLYLLSIPDYKLLHGTGTSCQQLIRKYIILYSVQKFNS